jgi:hypothetical protein
MRWRKLVLSPGNGVWPVLVRLAQCRAELARRYDMALARR